MIVLDTNVLSALMEAEKDPQIIAWLDAQDRESACTTTINVFEVHNGIERLDPGRRRADLTQKFAHALNIALGGRVLPLDTTAAQAAGRLHAARYRGGRPIGLADTLIAGIVVANGAALATKDVHDFSDLHVPVINPWEA